MQMCISLQAIRKVTLFSCLCFLLCAGLFAQTNYQPGYIITLEGDSVNGQIDDRNRIKNAESIQFLSSASDIPQLYLPHQIKGYGLLSGKVYESHFLKVDLSPARKVERKFSENPSPTLVYDSLFLTVMVKGELSLFYFRDPTTKNHFFVQKEGGAIEELINYRYKYEDPLGTINKARLKEVPQFRNQLKKLLFDCESLQRDILKGKLDHLPFREHEIQELVVRYNECRGNLKDAYIQKIRPNHQPRLDVSVIAGGSLNMININGGASLRASLATLDFEPSLGYATGLAFHFRSQESQGKWGFYSELLLQKLATTSDVLDRRSDFEQYRYQAEVDVLYLRFVSSLRYDYPKGDWRPFVHLGISNGLLVKDENSLAVTSDFFGIEGEEQGLLFERDLKKHDIAFVGGLGLKYQRLSGEFRLENGKGFSPIMGAGTPRTSLYLLLGYRLNK